MPDLADVIARLPADVARELRAALQARVAEGRPSPAARLDERDRAIRQLSDSYYADLRGCKGRADRIASDLSILAKSASPSEGATGRRKAILDVVALCRGRIPGKDQLRNILRGRRTPI